ncbi:MAG: hypothetical protein M1115_07335 [Actinobacteria bacterium]|nr:hypothetical protein [Actinomycetota bacterium]
MIDIPGLSGSSEPCPAIVSSIHGRSAQPTIRVLDGVEVILPAPDAVGTLARPATACGPARPAKVGRAHAVGTLARPATIHHISGKGL